MWRVFLLLLVIILPAQACLWDYDTLATEAKGLPDAVQVITGRFERNPPLFYEMRLARVSKEIKTTPTKLELYDDAGVACDRLHRDDEAIAWMRQKRAQLKAYPQDKEHWYRYHANLGTFQAHRWLRNGANRKNLGEMKTARDNIKRALQINPNAHFGREKVQLTAMEWIIKAPKKLDYERLPAFYNVESDDSLDEVKAKEKTKGLVGLIVLGDAWESLDIFYALRNITATRLATISYMASLRCEELAKQGKHSLSPHAPKGDALLSALKPIQSDIMLSESRWPDIEKQYTKLRAEAEEYQIRRTSYMMEHLKAGRHPDTDKTFWNDWKDSGPPVIDDPEPTTPDQWLFRLQMAVGFLIVFIVGLVIYFIRRHKKRRLLTA